MEISELMAEIESRKKSRSKECVDSDDHDDILRAQGAARELSQILDFVELKDNPPKKEPEAGA